jgi:hypothetical protein
MGLGPSTAEEFQQVTKESERQVRRYEMKRDILLEDAEDARAEAKRALRKGDRVIASMKLQEAHDKCQLARQCAQSIRSTNSRISVANKGLTQANQQELDGKLERLNESLIQDWSHEAAGERALDYVATTTMARAQHAYMQDANDTIREHDVKHMDKDEQAMTFNIEEELKALEEEEDLRLQEELIETVGPTLSMTKAADGFKSVRNKPM